MGLDSLSRGVYFTTYEALKTELGVSCAATSPMDQHLHSHLIGHHLHLRVCAAAFSGVIMWIIVSPLDVIRAQFYMSRDTCVEGVTRAIFRAQVRHARHRLMRAFRESRRETHTGELSGM